MLFLDINLANYYLIIGAFILLICAIFDRTIVGGTETRANFYLDKFTKSSNIKITNILFIVSGSFLLPVILYFFLN
ncbi:hypothetical protein LY28_02357 [Ruminiclostridium sufflavum DSM 19573]|uniref:Uncharacterized protein n=1 Tax=Ruminiclostridium sufflavum DSM 19573 TaxID=1121337 RepID=A0A318XNR0_9FIRM|nr:hypothetical protein [Ruminiclostridium sufflavum]PYG87219.1 hypothetical protein LY28_02357 [Ruminiclostridium sufflavum DSM 19573]